MVNDPPTTTAVDDAVMFRIAHIVYSPVKRARGSTCEINGVR